MTRDPLALHVGAIVDTPHGRAVIKARRVGPVTTWLALDWWWRESQISLVEPAPPVRRSRSAACRRDEHYQCGGGVLHEADGPVACACDCGHGGAA